MALQRPDLAHQTLTQALAKGVPSLELLHVAADEARLAGRRKEAREFYTRALALTPRHIPSLVALAEFAADDPATGLEPPVGLQQEIPNLSSEASPSEHCEALQALTRLALKRADFPTALSLLDRTAELEEAPAACLLELARMDRRIGRPTQALALLKRAAHGDSPGEAPLALGEQLQDARAALAELAVEPSRDASPAEAALWAARANAARVRANLMLGDRRAAEAAGSFLATDQGLKALLALARLRALGGEHAFASRALSLALRAARTSPERADDLVDVGEVALALGSPAMAAEACAEAAAAGPGNCRALICSARALRALGRLEEARAHLAKALAIDAEAPVPQALRADLGLAAPSAAATAPPGGVPAPLPAAAKN
jgi:tetratricopeptide (TPR) repeat protein